MEERTLTIASETGEIVSVDDAWERHKRIVFLWQTVEQTFLELATELYKFKSDGQFTDLGHPSFDSYLADPDVKIGKTTGHRLVQIHRLFVEFMQVPRVGLLPAGHHKLGMLAPYIERGNIDSANIENWLDNAGALSRSDLRTELKEHFDRGKSPAEWARILQGKSDIERAKKLDIRIRPYDVWNFQKCDERFGQEGYPGRIPGQLVLHILYFYSEQGDVVIDPMAGGGTTPDVCLVMNRQCHAYDVIKNSDRPDILTHDMRNGWPDVLGEIDLILWDPPYFSKKDKDYDHNSISALPRDKWISFFADRLSEAYQGVKEGTRLALLMSDWDDDKGEQEGIFLWDYARIIQDAGWQIVRHIQAPLPTQQVHPDIINKFRESKRLARLERYLLVAKA